MKTLRIKKFACTLVWLFSTCLTWSQTAQDTVLDQWHRAAAHSDLETYFNLVSPDFVFVGSQADEVWNKAAFYAYAQPHFAQGNGWKMQSLQRNWYGKAESGLLYFDELVDSAMGICRGSGVMKKQGETWKVAHYVLSLTIANELVPQVKQLNEKHYQTLRILLAQ